MTHRLRILLFLVGLAVFAFLLSRIGLKALVTDLSKVGWRLALLIVVYGAVYTCYAAAWQLIMSAEARRPPFIQTWLMTVSGLAINYLTPFVSLGGEPFKAVAATPWLGARRASGSIILYWVMHTLSHALIWITAVGLAFVMVTKGPVTRIVLPVVGVVVLALAATMALLFRQGVLEKILNGVGRLPLPARLRASLEDKREALVEIDAQMIDFFRASPARFLATLAIDYCGRALSMLEFYVIFAGLDLQVSYAQAFLLGGFTSLVLNALFFIPFEAGTREGGLYLLAQWIGISPEHGIVAALASRLRELAWIAIGLALVPLAGKAGTLRGEFQAGKDRL